MRSQSDSSALHLGDLVLELAFLHVGLVLELADDAQGLGVVVLHLGHLLDLVVELLVHGLPLQLQLVVVLRLLLLGLLALALLELVLLLESHLVGALLGVAHVELLGQLGVGFALHFVLVVHSFIISVLEILLSLLGVHPPHFVLVLLLLTEGLHALLLALDALVYGVQALHQLMVGGVQVLVRAVGFLLGLGLDLVILVLDLD